MPLHQPASPGALGASDMPGRPDGSDIPGRADAPVCPQTGREARQKRTFWLLALAVLLAVCLASPLFFAPFYQKDAPARGSGLPDLAAARQVDLNTADLDQLCTLPGIGPARAAAILEYRQAHGPFAAVEDVCVVRGIGEGIVEGWGGLACVSQPPAP